MPKGGIVLKKDVAIGIIALFIVSAVSPMVIGFKFNAMTDEKQIAMPTASGNILYVGGNGTGNYTKIQDAIDNASDGDMVFVYDDSSPYYENVIVDKSIKLVGEDRNTTVIDGRECTCIYISSNQVSVSNFTIFNASNFTARGIRMEDCSYNTIFNCNIHSNGDGIILSNSSYNTISRCFMHHNNAYYGVFLVRSSWNTISNCNLSNNLGGSFLWVYSDNNTIKNCLFYKNDKGIQIKRYSWDTTKNNNIYHNNFIKNSEFNAFDLFSNKWDNGKEGNYWDDYNGTDADGDGIGEMPYNISGDSNQDRYPLMEPYGMTKLTMNIGWGLLKFSGGIRNIGNKTAFNVQWKITINGGFILFRREFSSHLPRPLLTGEEMSVSSGIVFGFGRIVITVAVWADNAPLISRTITGRLLLLFFFQITPGP